MNKADEIKRLRFEHDYLEEMVGLAAVEGLAEPYIDKLIEVGERIRELETSEGE